MARMILGALPTWGDAPGAPPHAPGAGGAQTDAQAGAPSAALAQTALPAQPAQPASAPGAGDGAASEMAQLRRELDEIKRALPRRRPRVR
jgi:hypothetical protein